MRARGDESLITAALKQAEEEGSKKKLPELKELIPLVSPQIQEAIDEIFRARWTKVIRVKKRELFQQP